MEPDNPLGDLVGIDSRLRLAARRLRRTAGDRCPRAGETLASLDAGGGTLRETAPAAVREHLDRCSACRELVAAFGDAIAVDVPTGDVPRRVVESVGSVLARRPSTPVRPGRGRGRATFFRLRRVAWLAAVAALALVVAYVVLVPPSHPLLADVTSRQIASSEGSDPSAGPAGRGDRVVLDASLERPGYVYAVLSYTLGVKWELEWLEPCDAAENHRSDSHSVAGTLPDGALIARWALVALPRPLDEGAQNDLRMAAEPLGKAPAETLARLGALASRFGGDLRSETLKQKHGLPETSDPVAAMEALFTGFGPRESLLAARAYARENPVAAAIVVARLCDAEIARGGSEFSGAEALARAVSDERGDEALSRRVDFYRGLASDSLAWAERRSLDAAIRRDAPPHDDDVEALLASIVPNGGLDAARFLGDAAERYRAIGDTWGEIECEYRAALVTDDARAALERFERLAERSREEAYPRGVALALFGVTVATWRGARDLSLKEMGEQADRASIALIAARLDAIAGAAQSNFAFFCLVHGALGEAFERLRQAFLLHARAGADFEQAINLAKLSWAQELVGRPKDALELAVASAEWLDRLTSDSRYAGSRSVVRVKGKSLWRAACAAAALGENEMALSYARESLAVAESIGDSDTAGRARITAARAEAGAGRVDEALLDAAAAVAAFPVEENPWYRAHALATQGRVFEAAGRDADAEAAHRAAVELFERSNISDGIGAAESLSEIARLEEGRDEFGRALETRLRGLRAAESVIDERGLRAADRASLRARFRPAMESGAVLAYRLRSPDDALRFMEGARPAALGHLADRLVPDPERLEISTEGVAALLDAEAAWVEYLFGENASFAIVVSADGSASIRELGWNRAEIAKRADSLSIALRSGDVDALLRAGREAGEALLDPIADLIAGRDSLRLALDDAALGDSRFPPAALVTSDRRFLVQAAAIALEPSARIALDRALVAREARETDAVLDWVGPGCSAGRFVRARDGDVVGGDAATAAAFTGGVLAGHARIRVASRTCDFSVLEMAEGGAVDASDVARSPGLGGAIVVLDPEAPPSARFRANDLPRAFLTAGAGGVLSPLAPVPRAGADALLREFDRYAASAGVRTAEALRRAQLALMASDDVSASDPRSWAPWVLLGE